jgi:hypothetical protein
LQVSATQLSEPLQWVWNGKRPIQQQGWPAPPQRAQPWVVQTVAEAEHQPGLPVPQQPCSSPPQPPHEPEAPQVPRPQAVPTATHFGLRTSPEQQPASQLLPGQHGSPMRPQLRQTEERSSSVPLQPTFGSVQPGAVVQQRWPTLPQGHLPPLQIPPLA